MGVARLVKRVVRFQSDSVSMKLLTCVVLLAGHLLPCRGNFAIMQHTIQKAYQPAPGISNYTRFPFSFTISADFFNKFSQFGHFGPMTRQFQGAAGNLLAQYNNYGCWCYFQQHYRAGKSKPVNELDALCKRLLQGYECASVDDENCAAWEVAYTQPDSLDTSDILNECEAVNGADTCESRACIIENQFMHDFFNALLISQVDPQLETYSHAQDFTVEGGCPTVIGEASARECCGAYPERFPYRTLGGVRQCCAPAGVPYNSAVYDCCDDGTTAVTCNV